MSAPEWVRAWDRAEGAERVNAAFRDRFGGEPDGVWSAPGRVNVIGEHTDYNAGLCLPIALPHRTYVALRSRPDDVVAVASAQEAEAGVWTADLADVAPGTISGWGAYVAGVAWALRQAGHEVGGFDAVVDSCVPYGSGLSSSAALECAVAVALDDAYGLGLGGGEVGRAALVRVCMRAENEIAGAATGGLDQSASLLCRPGHALLLDFQDGSTRQVPFDLSAHDLALLVIDTRAEHQHAGGEYAARRASCERAAGLLGLTSLREVTNLAAALDRLGEVAGDEAEVLRMRVRHVVTENARVELVQHLVADDIEAVGPVLTAGHASLRDDYQVTCRELDLTVDTAIAAGGLGARMVGGGFGGSVIVLVRAAEIHRIADAVVAAFAGAALRAPSFLVATAEGPAGRD
jgi:galactokinase